MLGHKCQMYTGNVEHSPGFVDVESYKDCNAVISHSLPGKIQFLCRFCDWDLNHQPLQMLERQSVITCAYAFFNYLIISLHFRNMFLWVCVIHSDMNFIGKWFHQRSKLIACPACCSGLL